MFNHAELELDAPGIHLRTAEALRGYLTDAGITVTAVSERRAVGVRLFALGAPYDGGVTDIKGVALAIATHAVTEAHDMPRELLLAIARCATSGTHCKGAGWALDKAVRPRGGAR